MRIRVLLILIAFLGGGCKQVLIQDLHPVGELNDKLPPLKATVDLQSFNRAYAIQYNIQSGDFIPFVEIGTQENLLKIDKRIQESEALFKRMIRKNICNEGNPKGEIICRIISSDTRAYKKWLLVPNVLTLGLTNLLGVPFFFITKQS